MLKLKDEFKEVDVNLFGFAIHRGNGEVLLLLSGLSAFFAYHAEKRYLRLYIPSDMIGTKFLHTKEDIRNFLNKNSHLLEKILLLDELLDKFEEVSI